MRNVFRSQLDVWARCLVFFFSLLLYFFSLYLTWRTFFASLIHGFSSRNLWVRKDKKVSTSEVQEKNEEEEEERDGEEAEKLEELEEE